MDRKELAYTRQVLLNIKEWDDFQKLMRILVRMSREGVVPDSTR